MAMMKNFDIAGSALVAQSVRLNAVSSNMANAQSVAANPEEVYRSRLPVFQTELMNSSDELKMAGVRVSGILESTAEPFIEYKPEHPLANEDGYIFKPNINMVEEMANMISASQSYSSNIEVMNTSKQLMLKTLRMGQG